MNIYTTKFSEIIEFYVYEYLRSHKSKYGDIGTPYYIGKGKGKRAFSANRWIKRPKDKNNIRVSPLMTEADSLQSEMLKIKLYGRIDLGTGCLRNLTDGGEGTSGRTYVFTEEHRRKLSIAAKNQTSYDRSPKSKEHRNKLSLANIGHKDSPETRLKKSLCKLGIKKGALTKEQKIKMSEDRKGRIWINNELIEKWILVAELPVYEAMGFSKGILAAKRFKKLSTINSGSIVINNHITQKHIKPEDWPEYQKLGFVKGGRKRN